MSATKITTMAQLRDALQQGGHVNKHSYGLTGASYWPAKVEGKDKNYLTRWPTDVSLVAFNALLNRGELRRLDTSSYRSSDWVLKTAGYTVMEAEAKVNAAKQGYEGAKRVLEEAGTAYDAALAKLVEAEAALTNLVASTRVTSWLARPPSRPTRLMRSGVTAPS